MSTAIRVPAHTTAVVAREPTLQPFIKWPGGKSAEIETIAAASPPLTGRYLDPFVGGGAVLLAVPEEVAAWANDTSIDLIDLYRSAAGERPALRDALMGLASGWDALAGVADQYERLAMLYRDARTSTASSVEAIADITAVLGDHQLDLAGEFVRRLTRDLPGKLARLRRIEGAMDRPVSERDLLANIEGSVRAAYYMAVRARYNRRRSAGVHDGARSADFFFLREFAYAAMFRFNGRDEFNVPYGGMSYNRKSFGEKVRQLYAPKMLHRLQNTTWRSMDFELFLAEASVSESDFVFADPPYDSDFSSYDNLPFGPRDQERLRSALERLPARVMVVIKDTPLVRVLYRADRWNLTSAQKTYMWTIKSRNDRSATHLTITNY